MMRQTDVQGSEAGHPGFQTSNLRSGGAGKTDEPRPRRGAFVRARRRIASGVAPWRRDAPPDRATSPGRDAGRDNVMDDSRNAWQQARAVNAMIGAQRPAPHLTHPPGNEPPSAPPPARRKPLRLGALAPLALLAALAAAPAAAQTTVTLVSNIGQTQSTTISGNSERAQPFTTGSNATGYTLSSIDIVSTDSAGDSVRRQHLHDQRQRPSRHASGQPHRARRLRGGNAHLHGARQHHPRSQHGLRRADRSRGQQRAVQRRVGQCRRFRRRRGVEHWGWLLLP